MVVGHQNSHEQPEISPAPSIAHLSLAYRPRFQAGSLASIRLRMLRARASASTGLDKNASAPALRAPAESVASPKPVHNMANRFGDRPLILLMNSRPPSPGIIWSVTTRSKPVTFFSSSRSAAPASVM